MTVLELILAVSFGLFIVFAILVGIGAAVEQGNFLTRAKVAGRIAKSAEATARMWRRELDEVTKAHRELDQGVGRAVCRIIGAHSGQCAKGLECRRDPAHYYGREYDFRAAGIREALNILEEETGRYKEEKEEPSPAYLHALALRLAKVGKRLDAIKQSQEADRQRQQFVADQKREAQARVGAPVGHPPWPPVEPCVVCGGHARTFRWGQCISTWSSETNIESTFTTTKWQEFDQRFEVGWIPVCARHATDLDGHGSIAGASERYYRG